jgi:Epoxide hydrolase N terminus
LRSENGARTDLYEQFRKNFMTNAPRPFTINIAQSQLDDLYARLALTRFPEKEIVEDWDQGIPLSYVKEVAAYWAGDYDWRRCEVILNARPISCLRLTSSTFISCTSVRPTRTRARWS